MERYCASVNSAARPKSRTGVGSRPKSGRCTVRTKEKAKSSACLMSALTDILPHVPSPSSKPAVPRFFAGAMPPKSWVTSSRSILPASSASTTFVILARTSDVIRRRPTASQADFSRAARASLRAWWWFTGTAPCASPSFRVPDETTKAAAACAVPGPGRATRRRSSASRGAPRAVAEPSSSSAASSASSCSGPSTCAVHTTEADFCCAVAFSSFTSPGALPNPRVTAGRGGAGAAGGGGAGRAATRAASRVARRAASSKPRRLSPTASRSWPSRSLAASQSAGRSAAHSGSRASRVHARLCSSEATSSTKSFAVRRTEAGWPSGVSTVCSTLPAASATRVWISLPPKSAIQRRASSSPAAGSGPPAGVSIATARCI